MASSGIGCSTDLDPLVHGVVSEHPFQIFHTGKINAADSRYTNRCVLLAGETVDSIDQDGRQARLLRVLLRGSSRLLKKAKYWERVADREGNAAGLVWSFP
jgi:hypothetical protein